MFGHWVRLGAPALMLTAVVAAGQDTNRSDAARMEKKLMAIMERGARPPGKTPRAPLRTSFTDREVNAYFAVEGPGFLPTGLIDPQVFMDAGGKVRARAIVDLDKALKPSLFNPLSWLGGRTEVTAAGTVRGAEGMGVLQLESATLAGVSVPKSLLQQLVSYYTRTPEEPQGFNLDQPFPLPSGIQSVETAKGAAIIVQP
jgi:hypothetical protein